MPPGPLEPRVPLGQRVPPTGATGATGPAGATGATGPAGSGCPIGAIILWSGTIAKIPAGWALCDGTANSPGPDLRDKFIVGARQDDAGAAKTNLTGAPTVSVGAISHHHADHTVGPMAVSALSRTTDVALSERDLLELKHLDPPAGVGKPWQFGAEKDARAIAIEA